MVEQINTMEGIPDLKPANLTGCLPPDLMWSTRAQANPNPPGPPPPLLNFGMPVLAPSEVPDSPPPMLTSSELSGMLRKNKSRAIAGAVAGAFAAAAATQAPARAPQTRRRKRALSPESSPDISSESEDEWSPSSDKPSVASRGTNRPTRQSLRQAAPSPDNDPLDKETLDALRKEMLECVTQTFRLEDRQVHHTHSHTL
jgi:hypothetical protein